jgi:hypothetical protein
MKFFLIRIILATALAALVVGAEQSKESKGTHLAL